MQSPGLASSNLSCDFSLARRAASFNSLNWSANWRDKCHTQMCLHYPYIRKNQTITRHLPVVVCAATPKLFIIPSSWHLIFACFIMDHGANLKIPITTKTYRISFLNMHQSSAPYKHTPTASDSGRIWIKGVLLWIETGPWSSHPCTLQLLQLLFYPYSLSSQITTLWSVLFECWRGTRVRMSWLPAAAAALWRSPGRRLC